jgi:hypothetical protein
MKVKELKHKLERFNDEDEVYIEDFIVGDSITKLKYVTRYKNNKIILSEDVNTMFFEYKGIDFDVNVRTKEEVIELFDKIIPVLPKIVQVYIEDDEYGEIFVDVNEDVEQIGEKLSELGIESSPSDEDYGQLQSINLYFL